jgi:CHAT domain-containing protein
MDRENEKIKISAHEKLTNDSRTVRRYEYQDVHDDEINKTCAAVVDLLNRANKQGKINRETLKELQVAGHLLYDSLLTNRVKEKLSTTDCRHLIVSVDDRLVQIPWELLFDGNSFLCQRFNMGRIVSTSQSISEPSVRKIEKPVKMLIIADPRGDLEASYKEGVRLRDELDTIQEKIKTNLRSSLVDVHYVKKVLRDFDILHYAGHADYDINDPSKSGYILADGKLMASDIVKMIGSRPLPSLVFSNACKSGHTDMWQVGDDYETSIYGLANAFLLAGVQHYIGTFWDVQDEPSLYFSLDFYRELMNGEMVGEAIRKARLKSIERYGEDTVIWASYTLYGDPTVRYVDLLIQEAADDIREGSDRAETESEEEEVVVRGNVRGMEEAMDFQPKQYKWMFISAMLILTTSIIIAYFIFQPGERTLPLQKTVESSKESAEAKDRRIDTLVTTLVKQYNEDQKIGKRKLPSSGKSTMPSLVFLNIKPYGVNEADIEYIFTRVSSRLQNSKRVHVIDREIIDKLLNELALSSSQLADPETALRIGRIVSANLISVGSILRDNNDWQVSLRFIETETTSIKTALAEIIETKEKNEVAGMLSREILNRIRAAYPLQGNILSFKDEKIVLDIGYKDGVNIGLKMTIISEAGGEKVGELEITSVDEDTSNAKIMSQRGVLQEGLRVEENI